MEHDRSTDIGPQTLEHCPNSIPEGHTLVRPESPNLSLVELYVKNRAITHWEGPKYTSYNTKDARLRSFIVNDWSHGLNPTPEALADAGLFSRVSSRTQTLLITLYSYNVLDLFNLSQFHLQVRVIGPSVFSAAEDSWTGWNQMIPGRSMRNGFHSASM